MSLSNLSSQLAALSNANTTNAGFAHPSNRTNNESVGRGFHHSNKHGHAVVSIVNDPTKKASVLFEDARRAAEVDAGSLRESAVVALGELVEGISSWYLLQGNGSRSGDGDSGSGSDERSEEIHHAIQSIYKSHIYLNPANGILSNNYLSNFERGTANTQQNQQVDEQIDQLMTLLATCLCECAPPSTFAVDEQAQNMNDPILMAVLQIVEYLIRHYQIHARPHTAHMMLRTFLPVHLIYPQLFQRVLSLIDLTTAGGSVGSGKKNATMSGGAGTWAFLRPYAASGAKPINAKGLAKIAARDDSLAMVLCDIGKRSGEVCVLEGRAVGIVGRNGLNGGALPVRKGISAILSFSVGILVEALHIQSISSEGRGSVRSGGAITGGVQESLVRKLLPLVLGACRSGGDGAKDGGYCPEWKEWGRLMASTLAMLCSLNGDVKTALCDAIVDGLPSVDKRRLSNDGDDQLMEGNKDRFSTLIVDDASSAIMALLAVLGSSKPNDVEVNESRERDVDDDEWKYYLPMLPAGNDGSSNIIDYMGCDLPSSVYRAITKKCGASNDGGNIIAMAMGTIIQSINGYDIADSDHQDDDNIPSLMIEKIAPIVASFVMHVFQRLEKESSKLLAQDIDASKKKKRKSRGIDESEKFRADRDVALLVDMINEPSLASLWSSNFGSLIAAVTVHTINSYDNIYNSQTNLIQESSNAIILNRYKSILEALSRNSKSVHDLSVAFTLRKIAQIQPTPPYDNTKKNDGTKQQNRMQRLASLLGHTNPSSVPTQTGSNELFNDEIQSASLLLPPRVALENADASVRLHAITRLKKSIDEGIAQDMDLGQALLRRLATDDDASVANAAGALLVSQLKAFLDLEEETRNDSPPMAFASLADDLGSLAKEVLSAMFHWSPIMKGHDSWSPSSPLVQGNTTKQDTKKMNPDISSPPILMCFSICGAVGKLMLKQESVEGILDDKMLKIQFASLILTLAAHVTSGDRDISRAALKELLNLAIGDDSSNSVTNSIATHPVNIKILSLLTNGDALTANVPTLMRNRYVWLALHAHSNSLSSSVASDSAVKHDLALRMMDLMLYQMQFYKASMKKKSSFVWEIDFLSRSIGDCLLILAEGNNLDRYISKLSSVSSVVAYESIVKPSISSQLTALSNISSKLSGIVVLVHSCLQSDAVKQSTLRLLDISKESFDSSPNINAASSCIIPTLALLTHPEKDIRESIVRLLDSFQYLANDSPKDDTSKIVSFISKTVSDKTSSVRSSLLMDGTNSLPHLVSQIILASDAPGSVREFLIEKCKECALNGDAGFSVSGSQAAAVVLSALEKSGETVISLQKRWEGVGKNLFEKFLSSDGDGGSDDIGLDKLRDCVVLMLKGVRVNRAQSGDSGLNIQISIGPSQTGSRLRSYSVGASDDFSIMDSYPDDMVKAILDALTMKPLPYKLSRSVINLVLTRQSWIEGVFTKLDTKSRHSIASALLSLRSNNDDELAGSTLLGLPLKTSELIHLLSHAHPEKSESDQVSVSMISDCVRGRIYSLGKPSDISKLSSKLFDHLVSLSSSDDFGANSGDLGGREYTRIIILQTLYTIHDHYKAQLAKNASEEESQQSSRSSRRSRSSSGAGISDQTVSLHAGALVGLLGGKVSSIRPLSSGRGRALSLGLLTRLCEQSPSAVVSSLLPALMSLAETSFSTESDESEKKSSMAAIGEALSAIVPAYCIHAHSANLSLFALLKEFVGKIVTKVSRCKKTSSSLFDRFVEALRQLPTKQDSNDATASFVACIMAIESYNIQLPRTDDDGDDLIMSGSDSTLTKNQANQSIRLLTNSPTPMRIAVSLSLLQYAEELMSSICGQSDVSVEPHSVGKLKVDISQVASLALVGPNNNEERKQLTSYSEYTDAQKRSILYLAVSLLQTVRDATSTPSAKKFVRKSQGNDVDLCLCLWQKLMQTHVNALRAHSKLIADDTLEDIEKRFWLAATTATSACLENLQNILPVPHFLATVSSTLSDDSVDDYIRKKTIRLLSARVAEVDADSPEAMLFLEAVPELVSQVSVPRPEITDEESLVSYRRAIVMKQGALIAIESFGRSLYPTKDDSKLVKKAADVFIPALTSVTRLLEESASSWIKSTSDRNSNSSHDVGEVECQLLSSSALCIYRLVTILKARCIPLLPSIMKPLLAALTSINKLIDNTTDEAGTTGKFLQLSILRTLSAVAETLPQFLFPYLPLLFSKNALPSKALHRGAADGENSVRAATEQVSKTLATLTPIRQLIPALSQALGRSLSQNEEGSSWEEASAILQVMKTAVESSQRSELTPVVAKIFNGLVASYAYEGNDADDREELLSNANKCLLALVMKLSEAQLRPLYARLREWRGDIKNDKDSSSSSCVRRFAFWNLSAELSKFLRGIFLPCLTSVITDVIDELEIAVSILCKGSKAKLGSKRLRLDESGGGDDDLDQLRSLQPLLLCLESALKADAHEGGNWTRGDDTQRYNMILSHLGKLLLSHVPSNMVVKSDLPSQEKQSCSKFQQIIQGVGTLEHGNVAGCLTSLAAAAGNEQLWKPLNFAVLEACGHKRSEVRKAGISCLLAIIETIGEEYMVLLPECLPILSELLEDGDEEIAGMAKECVRQGEELLGESLEDSLR
ncbi:hypothetical protein ACHAXS_009933 [Conticribra weissflogii]